MRIASAASVLNVPALGAEAEAPNGSSAVAAREGDRFEEMAWAFVNDAQISTSVVVDFSNFSSKLQDPVDTAY